MSHKLHAALKELDRRINEQLNNSRVKRDSSQKDPLKRVTQARITVNSGGIEPPLSVDDIWSHCVRRRFAYTRSVSIKKLNKIDIYVKR
jgi:hypothetical protein